MKSLLVAFCLILMLSVQFAVADSTDYFSNNFLRYTDFVYRESIKTVKLNPVQYEFGSPIIELNSNEQLLLSFDDLDADTKDYWYTYVHCDANWQPSQLSQMQYINGFTENRIADYRFSYGTLQRFTHYELKFPIEESRPMYSGNYLLKVILGNNPDSLILTKRFMVVEKSVEVVARTHQGTSIEERNAKQEVDFSIRYESYQIQNPFGDLKTVVLQNGRWDNAITNLKPLYLKDKELDYDYDEENNFWGGNEFRHFDLRSLRYETEYIKSINKSEDQIDVYLMSDGKRSFDRYSTQPDINGKYEIRNYDGNESDLAADYAFVHFTLLYDEPLQRSSFYILGELTNWQLRKENRLTYNYDTKVYEGVLYLKQGYYNYQYVLLEDGKTVADETYVEGSHWETTNEYLILVYHRPPGARYDKLIGFTRTGM